MNIKRNKFWSVPESKLPTSTREKKVAKRIGAQAVSGSGATPWEKQDLKMEHFLIQHKQTGKRYHTVDLEQLKQLRSDAVHVDKTPIYMLEFDSGESYYLIDQIGFDMLQSYMEEQ